jgi:hypothetical protein
VSSFNWLAGWMSCAMVGSMRDGPRAVAAGRHP